MTIRFLICAVLAAGPAAACPPGADTVLSCTARGGSKTLEVCTDGVEISYAYGRAGGPAELFLVRDVAKIENRPWPGIGRTLWEETTFRNQGHAYVVHISVDRLDETALPEGGVTVMQGGKTLANVDCDPGSAEVGIWTVSDAKQALGICWDLDNHTWTACD